MAASGRFTRNHSGCDIMAKAQIEILATKEKYSNEVVVAGRWGPDFEPDMEDDETISSATLVVNDMQDNDVTSTLVETGTVSYTGTTATAQFQGGTAGERYIAVFTCVSNKGGTYIAVLEIVILKASLSVS